LPYLPAGINSLDCSYDRGLSCLPHIFMNSLFSFYMDSSNITCLPNRFSAIQYDINPGTVPLCDPASGCEFYYNLAGNIHYDTVATCLADSVSQGNSIYNMKVQLIQGGNVIQQFYSFTSGGYSFQTPSLSTYSVAIDTTMLPISVVCPSSDLRTVTLSPTDTVEKYESFGMQCSAVDFGVSSIWGTHFRATFTSYISINAGNFALMNYNANCGAGTPGTVTTMLSGSLHYISAASGALTPTSVSGNTLTYTIADLNALQSGSLNIVVATDTNAAVGSDVCVNVTVTPSVPDANPSNNTLSQCFAVVHSWDPNDKEVYPLDTFQENNSWLTYTINFQNTGTDTAYTVIVQDTLSQYVDASSFQYLASSNKAVIQLFGNACVFTFPHINLVDSAANPPLSTGWIEYKVKAKPGLPPGTKIYNTAYVYFDNNSAVVTNTTVNTYDTLTSVLLTCSDTTVSLNHAICQGDSFMFNGIARTTQGVYYDSLQNIGGCDSTIALNLRVNPLPVVTWNPMDTMADLWCQCAFWTHQIIFAGANPAGGMFNGVYVSVDSITMPYPDCTQEFFDTNFVVVYTYADSNGCSNSVSRNFNLNMGCEGIQTIDGANSISLYPNPNKGSFTLQTSNKNNIDYTISDMLGNIVAQLAITSDSQEINLPEIGEGVYTLVVKGSQPVRFVVVR
jgi:uncharacterized repeat protein (TIGR01451 family)